MRESGAALRERAATAVARAFPGAPAILTDSGTSALILALQATGTDVVAMPAYACIDLAAAARFAGVSVRLYDVDPETLGPDEPSLRAALDAGVSAIVVAHLFGFPVPLDDVRGLADEYGALVIEDAAQGAGAEWRDRPLGVHGDLGVLSFGRGKGTSAAGGGALLASTPAGAARIAVATLTETDAVGGLSLVASGAQWLLGRPTLYALPNALPFLRLGEMVYHPAHAPRPISRSSAALLPTALVLARTAVADRRVRGTRLRTLASEAGLGVPSQNPRAAPGYLRLPVLVRRGVAADKRLGLVRPYPIALIDHAAMQPALAVHADFPGARELAARLVTVPTHSQVVESDERQLARWMISAR